MNQPPPLSSRHLARLLSLTGLLVAVTVATASPSLAQAPSPTDPARMLSTLNEVRRETRRLREQALRDRGELAREIRTLRQQAIEGEQREGELRQRIAGMERRSTWTLVIGSILLALVALMTLLALRRRVTPLAIGAATIAGLRNPVSDLDRRLQRLEAGMREAPRSAPTEVGSRPA